MKLQSLLFSLAVGFTATAEAAFTTCVLESMPCDRKGGRYFCTMVGWTGPNPPEFCSDHDASTGPGKGGTNTEPVPFSYCRDSRGLLTIGNFQPAGALGTASFSYDGKSGDLNCGVSTTPSSKFLVACSGSIGRSPAIQQARLRIAFPEKDPEKIGVMEISTPGQTSTINEMIPVICF